MPGQKSVAKIKGGNNVSVALWENQIQVKGKTMTMLKATLQKRYLDKNQQWRTSESFAKAELPDAIYCMQKAFEKMIEMKNEEDGDSVEEEMVM